MKKNVDKIREMADDELARVLLCPASIDDAFVPSEKCEMNDPIFGSESCLDCSVRWLHSEGGKF